MENLPMCTTHGRQAMPIGKELAQPRIDLCFVSAFVRDNAFLNNAVRLEYQVHCLFPVRIIERISNGPQFIEISLNQLMFFMKGLRDLGWK